MQQINYYIKTYIITICLTAFPLLLSGKANETASTQAKNKDIIVPIEEFKVIGSKDNVYTLTGSGMYLGGGDLKNLDFDDINRILRKTPGVYIREEDGYGLFPNISLRGVDTTRSGKVTIMEDGILAAPATYSAPSAYYSPTAGRMAAIEVLKGSSQIADGPHTTGGVINYISTPIPSINEKGNLLKASYGSDNEISLTSRIGKTIQKESGKFGYLFEVYRRQNEGFKSIDQVGEMDGSNETGFNRTDYMFKATWEPNTIPYNYFEVKVAYTDLEANETYLGLTSEDFKLDPYRRYAASRNDTINTNHTILNLRHIIKLNDNTKLSTTAYYNKFHRNWFKLHDIRDIDTDGNGIPQSDEGEKAVKSSNASALAGSVDGQALEVLKGTRAGKLRVRNNNRDYYMAGIQSKLNISLNTASIEHDIELGFRFHKDRIRRFQWHNLYLQDSDGNFVSHTQSAFGSDGNRRQETQANAFHFLDKIQAGPWTITPGIRYEDISYEYIDFTSDGSNVPKGDGSSELDILAPGLSVNYQSNENVLFFGGYNRGFSVPGPRNHVKKGLLEETSDAFEFGTRINNNDGSLYGELVLFHTSFDNLIVADNIGGAGTGDSENIGSVKSTGIEGLIGFDLGVSNNWGFRNPYSISITCTKATLDGDANSEDAESIFAGGRDGNYVPYIPKFQGNFTTGFETRKFRAYLSASYISETYTTATNSSSSINPNTGSGDARFGETNSCLIIDVSAYYEAFDDCEIFLSINNLFKDKYVASRHPYGARPGAPFLGRVGIQYKF